MEDINNANTVKKNPENIALFKKIHNTPINIKNTELFSIYVFLYKHTNIRRYGIMSLPLFYVSVKKK